MGSICSKSGKKNQEIIEKQAIPEISKAKTREMLGSDTEKILGMSTKNELGIRITTDYPTLHEPSIQFSPQMRKIDDYYGRGFCDEVEDEFQMEKRLVTAGDPISYDEFLKIITNQESKRIALIGGAGNGKSTEMKKLAKKLLNGKGQNENVSVQQQLNMIHTINFKDMRPKDSTSLQDCLFENSIPNADGRKQLLERIEKNQSNCIILIDGLDQAPYDTTLENRKVSHWEEASTETLMYNLLSGNIFPDVKVVVSSREHAISTLPEEARPKCVVALAGLKKVHAKSLFLDLVQEDEQLWKNIELNHGDLLSVLVIPIYLIFTAVVYKHSKKKNERLPTYVTGLLAKIIGILPNNKQMKENMIDILQKLKKLAYDGIKDRLLSFDEVYLNNHGLTAKEVSDFMSKLPTENVVFHRLLKKDYFYFFCHQSMEEFLAACYILEMSLIDFKSFIEHEFKEEFDHWSNVIQYLSGIALNQEIQLDQILDKISDKNKKKEILRDALGQPPADEYDPTEPPPPAYYLALHESNDDELIRQLQETNIGYTPLTSNVARAISSLMRRSESMEEIWLRWCGITDELLRFITENMKNSHLRVKRLELIDDEWDVTCSTLNSFLDNLEVDQLRMQAFPPDYHEVFPNFENVKTLMIYLYDVIITNEQERVLFDREINKISGSFDKKEKLLKLHFRRERNDDLVSNLKKLCSPEKVEVTEG